MTSTGVWRRFLPRARIRVRIVAAVVLAMTVVLAGTSAFVFWRIHYALDRQLDRDLWAYTSLVTEEVAAGERLPSDNPGTVTQTFSIDGQLLASSDPTVERLLPRTAVAAVTGTSSSHDTGVFLPVPEKTPYRLWSGRVSAPGGEVVLVTATSREPRDEALRELLLQLGLADLAVIVAAALVGYAAAGAALGPVERFRVAAASAGGDGRARLPVDPEHDDELSRLGATFNDLLDAIEAGHRRERQFLADASHELRSPLAVLAAEVEWAQHRPRTPAEMETVLASLGEQIRRLADLADALLGLEEASESGGVRRERVSLASLVDAPDDVLVDLDVADVTVEPRWLRLAVSNLIANARTHGAGPVTVRGRVTDRTLTIDVTDEGGGIPPELGEAAFTRFARADNARTSPGSGLGLAIVAAVAHRHGGQAVLVPGGVRIEIPAGGR